MIDQEQAGIHDKAKNEWSLIDLRLLPEKHRKSAFRLNALGSNFYFGRGVLGYKQFTPNLHHSMCRSVERDTLKSVKEYPRGHFKALSVDTPIPTPTGMVQMGELQVGDEVLGSNRNKCTVIGVSEINYRPMYSVKFSTGDVIVCDADHLWVTESRRERDNRQPRDRAKPNPKILTTREIMETLMVRKERNHRVKVAGEAHGASSVTIPHYTLGAWLGDGSSEGGQITCNDPEIISRIEKDGFIVTKHKAKFMHGILGLAKLLRKAGLKFNKHIPEEYLSSPIPDRWELLRGLMDTDGSASKLGQCTFSNTNLALMKQVRRLICSLGIKASPIGKYRSRLNGEHVGEFYVVSFYCYADCSPFNLPRKTARLGNRKKVSLQDYRQIDSVEFSGMGWVKCIMVDSPDSMYLAGEGYIPTHNTTVFSITTPMWWALPFTDADETMMRTLGYGDEWIRWMKRAHDQNTSTLILSEVDENAQKMGREITTHYRENITFQQTFPEIIPSWNRQTIWNMSSMTHKRSTGGTREGTYEVSGVGGALQSRHYPRIIEDDLFGEKALYSPTEAEYIIEFHRKLPGLFRADSSRPDHIGDNLVVGNRWAVNDLNGWIRKNQPSYDIETHAVDGGCCADHPKGMMIFPELFGPDKVRLIREQSGPTAFAAQYLNNPLDESNRVFRDEWLQHYSTQNVPHPFGAREADGSMKLLTALQHETFDGKIQKDVYLSQLQRFLILDPAHTEDEKRGRARHAIQTIGYLPGKTPRFYLLNSWAAHCTYSEMVSIAFKRAHAWKVSTIWCEVLAGQDGWMYYLRQQNRDSNIRVEPLRKDRSPGAKERRIMGLEPMFANHQIWASRSDSGYTDFRFEYDAYKSNQTIDLLDTLGYAPQCVDINAGDRETTADWLRRRENFISNQMGVGYSQ